MSAQSFAVDHWVDHKFGKIDRLQQSIPAKVSRGELVPQDPNDESASAILERVRAERAEARQTASEKTEARNRDGAETPTRNRTAKTS
jgi:hypothetical protein